MREPVVIAHRTEKCIVCNVVWLQNQTVLSCFHKYIVSKRKEVTNYLYMRYRYMRHMRYMRHTLCVPARNFTCSYSCLTIRKTEGENGKGPENSKNDQRAGEADT